MRLPAFLGDAMADKNNRLYRDPDSLAAQQPSQAELNRIGYWTTFDREAMDERFRLAMTTAQAQFQEEREAELQAEIAALKDENTKLRGEIAKLQETPTPPLSKSKSAAPKPREP